MLYSEMSREELERKIDQMRREIEIRKDQGLFNAVAVLKQKINMAASYLKMGYSGLGQEIPIRPGETYRIKGQENLLKVSFIRGVMAWGELVDEQGRPQEAVGAQAFPINLLVPVKC